MSYTVGDWGTLVLRLAPPQGPVEGRAGLAGLAGTGMQCAAGSEPAWPSASEAPTRDLWDQPTSHPPLLSLAPLRGLSLPTLEEGEGGDRGELRQTYFQGFNPFRLKDFFFFFFLLGEDLV